MSEGNYKLALEACAAALEYDKAISKHARDGQVNLNNYGAGIAVGDDLDALYEKWISLARKAMLGKTR